MIVCTLKNLSSLHRIAKASKSSWTNALVRGNEPSTCTSAELPVASRITPFGASTWGACPRMARKRRIPAASRGDKRGMSKPRMCTAWRFRRSRLRRVHVHVHVVNSMCFKGLAHRGVVSAITGKSRIGLIPSLGYCL
eukprot:1407911-Prymnesium_polylepis.1